MCNLCWQPYTEIIALFYLPNISTGVFSFIEFCIRAVLGWALFPFMYKQYLLHLYKPSNSHYDLLRHAQIHVHLC